MSTPSSSRLEIDGVAKAYGAVKAVESVSLAVEPGEVLALLGPSGCGKTTLLQSIAGFVVPDAGDIRLDGASILVTPPEKRRTAMLFQQYALFPHMSVRDNIGFGLRMARVPKVEAARRIEQALALVRITQLAERRPAQLSGGQRQRVALARAVVTEPRLLLLDEPLGALDQNLREEMQVELRKLQRNLGLTTVMVTHDQREAIVLSDRIAVMKEGRIEQIGTPLDIHDHPRTHYVATFTGVENLLPGRFHGEDVVELAGQRIVGVQASAAKPGAVTLAIRSEAITVLPPGQGDIEGTIGFVQMLGASVRYEVAIATGLTVTVTEVRRDAPPFELGAAVSIRLAASRCSVLAS
ncbi:ABC transporter ATP-binding protein [Bosea psychrotolerans]|uniref:Putative spermidine/putrescine transport system ATP-binding protein n=1 Tax=Bosea psychrotolerans TaxID=1871628 RepID=A0A2S4LXK2_9HYPH|nr:ABC transporter ATP-binding protein [Bosea psychrotolerans]POR47184.1 putative spermidine/putrescine transport system ATP-binding protein [Bosea psychrotolerans]